MRYSETHQLFDQTFEFPVDHDTVVEMLGDVELTAQGDRTVTVRSVLSHTKETTYHSADELYATLIGNLQEEFIGRKYYDDRAGVHSERVARRE